MPAAFIARHPIFNSRLDVVGYELLFRGRGYMGGPVDDPARATATVVLNSFTELELQRIVGNKRAWVNISRQFILDGLVQAIPPHLGGLEIPETELCAEGQDELVAALRDLKTQGYKIALDDFRGRPESEAHIDLFDVVKLNMLQLGRESLREQVERLRPRPVQLLADKLGTRPDHEFCADIGCDLFQGHFFCQPAVVGTQGISPNRLTLLQVVATLHNRDVELSDIAPLITRDVALSFRMLRYVNSAYFGLRGEVRSIGQALALLGLENVRRWATLSVLASVDDKPTELTVTALVRARFCELAAEPLGWGSPAELFTLGLFSVIDAMMDAPMQDVIESLPLADDIREALVYRRGDKGQLLDCVVALEEGDYSVPPIVPGSGELYLRSLIWANTAAESLFGVPEGESAFGPAEAPAAAPAPVPAAAAQPAPAPAQPATAPLPAAAAQPAPAPAQPAAAPAPPAAAPAPPAAAPAGPAPGTPPAPAAGSIRIIPEKPGPFARLRGWIRRRFGAADSAPAAAPAEVALDADAQPQA